MTADGVTVAQHMHITFVSSFQPVFSIPTQEKSCLAERMARVVWCIIKHGEKNLLYETVGEFSAQTHILS